MIVGLHNPYHTKFFPSRLKWCRSMNPKPQLIFPNSLWSLCGLAYAFLSKPLKPETLRFLRLLIDCFIEWLRRIQIRNTSLLTAFAFVSCCCLLLLIASSSDSARDSIVSKPETLQLLPCFALLCSMTSVRDFVALPYYAPSLLVLGVSGECCCWINCILIVEYLNQLYQWVFFFWKSITIHK